MSSSTANRDRNTIAGVFRLWHSVSRVAVRSVEIVMQYYLNRTWLAIEIVCCSGFMCFPIVAFGVSCSNTIRRNRNAILFELHLACNRNRMLQGLT